MCQTKKPAKPSSLQYALNVDQVKRLRMQLQEDKMASTSQNTPQKAAVTVASSTFSGSDDNENDGRVYRRGGTEYAKL